MATALSRMELTDQSRASLGEAGAIEPLVKMFNAGNLEAKLCASSALQNLSSLKENIQRLINSGIVVALLQLLFSVTSVLMTLREPASAILARIAQSESILVSQDIAQQMLSLLHLSSPVIKYHLLQALNSIAAHPSASKVKRKMRENGAVQLLQPFLTETNTKIRTGALELIYTLSKDLPGELTEQLQETHLNIIVNIISTSIFESEKAAAAGILSNFPVSDKKVTDIIKKANLLPIIVSIMSSIPATSTPTTEWLTQSIAGAVSPLVQSLLGNEREADEAILGALATLLQDEIWENGSNYIAKNSGVQAIIKVPELGTVKAQEQAVWMLERIFRVEAHRVQYGESAQVVLIDLAQKGDPKLKPTIAKLLAQLELLANSIKLLLRYFT
ncbi:hypothetical protein F0562_027007 [Nyssa sinensis]|uniref:Armadillo repeat-containing domain-containing protein n=1 Tax=Nyssa sinensis TaxID=561372 RepID=A0A5J5B4Z7_9ASTE|nr:hypothetical protein F0562_027007 [Nyssa sinensis]